MGDYIERQVAIDAILGITPMRNTIPLDSAIFNIKKLPSADVQPVVRCKDCKHRHLDGMIWNCPFGLSGGEGFFCAYGAKDGEQNETD